MTTPCKKKFSFSGAPNKNKNEEDDNNLVLSSSTKTSSATIPRGIVINDNEEGDDDEATSNISYNDTIHACGGLTKNQAAPLSCVLCVRALARECDHAQIYKLQYNKRGRNAIHATQSDR